MAKRDLVTEILQKRSRTLRRGPRYDHFLRRHDGVVRAEAYLLRLREPGVGTELLKYIPIALVACLESYFRLALRDLINFGAPYHANASKLEDIRLDLSTILAIGSGRVSAGEFVAHLVTFRSLDDVTRHMTVVLGASFITSLKSVPLEEDPTRTLGDRAGWLFTSIGELFRQRQIYCHELATKAKPTVGQITELTRASQALAYGTEYVVRQLIGP